jgi:hypothetical protein
MLGHLVSTMHGRPAVQGKTIGESHRWWQVKYAKVACRSRKLKAPSLNPNCAAQNLRYGRQWRVPTLCSSMRLYILGWPRRDAMGLGGVVLALARYGTLRGSGGRSPCCDADRLRGGVPSCTTVVCSSHGAVRGRLPL